MNAPLRKGWCPGALRPMMAKDGLLVRLRLTGGILPAATAHGLADLAARYGSGLFDLSGRGNLQMRGISGASLQALQDGLAALGLLDRDAGGESVRNVMASPLAGLHGGLDIRPLVHALEKRLADDTTLHALPGKFGFLIDDGSWPSLAGIAADVRFDWIEESAAFSIGLDGSRDSALRVGACPATELADQAARIAKNALSLLAISPDTRRMRDLIASFGADTLVEVSGGTREDALAAVPVTGARAIVGQRTARNFRADTNHVAVMVRLSSGPANQEGFREFKNLGLAAPFGRLDHTMLHAAAAIAATTSRGELRLTPWRVMLIPDAPNATKSVAGFITDPADPRLSIAACVGIDGCERGTTSTHVDATRLAADAASTASADILLHVSGCAKGCAKPSRSRFTLVAREGRYDFVRDGRAGDPPSRHGLDLDAACAMLEAARTMLEPARA